MSEVLDVSSDSSDTIILSYEENCPERIPDHDSDVEALVNKYIAQHCSDIVDVEVPVKRLKVSRDILESSSQDDSQYETDTLQKLHEKYNHCTVDKFYEQKEVLKENSEPLCNKELKKQEKELQKLKRIQEREQKKKELEYQKTLKQALATANKNCKPSECMKFITVQIDYELANAVYSSNIKSALQEAEVQYEIQSQIFPYTVTWIRRLESHSVDDTGNLIPTADLQDADEVLLIINCKDFLEKIINNTLCSYIQSAKSVLIDKKITLIVYGLQSYQRYLKNQHQKEVRQQITDDNKKISNKPSFFRDFPKVPKKTIEYGLTELELIYSCSHRLIDSASELGLLVAQFTKAVAEVPFKLQRYERFQQTDWFAAGDNRDCVKVDKNGNGLNRLWNQMLTTFPLARLETAEAVSFKYATVSALMAAYDNCESTREAELLLQDIPIRRAAGPLSSSRKIGPELSKKIYNFFTTMDGDKLL